ncbi:hypothetical protein E2986_12548 [Frieseomelitta varia]|uniref:Protein G12 n=1 Tax=Frieseomelitta varia TaxID=561572 RepID=A0A833VRC2_9HYME|nr:protein G12 [Frieseomelitta varia]KAF3429356.1 hypothetical protein E2986_12548 [Frieseomelitta varia]
MKAIVALFVVLVAASPLNAIEVPATGSGALAKEFQSFVDLVPVEKVAAVTRAYLAQDKEFQTGLKIVRGSEVKQWIQDIEQASEFKMLVNYMQNHGLDIVAMLKAFNKAIGIPPLFSVIRAYLAPQVQITGGLQGYMQDILAILPSDEILKIYEDKMEHSEVFKDFVYEIISSKYLTFYQLIFKNKHYQIAEDEAAKAGIDRYIFQISSQILLEVSAFM